MLPDAQSVVPLVGFWLRQYVPFTVRTAAISVGIGTLFLLTGNQSAETMSALLVGTSFAYGIPPFAIMFRDRASGDLEMITGLPVTPPVISASLAIATALVVLPGAASLAMGARIGMSLLGSHPPPLPTLLLGTWIVLWFLSWMVLALSTALSQQAFMNGPVGAAGLLMLALVVLPDIEDPVRIVEWLTTPPGSLVAVTVGLVLLMAGAFAFHRLTCYGLAHYEVVPTSTGDGWLKRRIRRSAGS